MENRESNCSRTMEGLVRALETGAPLDAEARGHLASCASCGSVLQQARSLQQELESGPEESETSAEAAVEVVQKAVVARSLRADLVRVAVALVISSLLIVAIAWFAVMIEGSYTKEFMVVSALTVAAIAVPVALFLLLLTLNRRSARPFYKRLKPGRQLSGVCLGIAERMDVSVTIVRLIAFLLIFADGAGLWLYIVLDLMMPIHPDDRVHLLRFRLARAWQRWQAAR